MQRIILLAMIALLAELAVAQTTADIPNNESSLIVYADVKPACPRRGCWAATHEALLRLPGVAQVDMDSSDTTLRRVEMSHGGLPDPAEWETQFRQYVGTASEFRGVVISLTGTIVQERHRLCLEVSGIGTLDLRLLDRNLKLAQSPVVSEPVATEFNDTDDDLSDLPTVPIEAMITGLLKKEGKRYSVAIRQLQLLP